MDKKAVIGIIVAAILLLIGSVGAIIYKNIRLSEIEEQQIIAAENKENGYDENGEPILYNEYSDPDNTGNHENLGGYARIAIVYTSQTTAHCHTRAQANKKLRITNSPTTTLRVLSTSPKATFRNLTPSAKTTSS